MKILISADMEGVTGVTNWDQVTPGHPEYARFRRLMTGDVNAAVRGAFDGGVEEVLVADGHWHGSNILLEELDPRAKLHSGTASRFSMMQGIELGVHAVIFIGYHARHGSTDAVLDHTWSSSCVQNLWINGKIAGEYTLNGALAGHFGAPVLLASGDQTACAQIAELIPSAASIVVKRATGRFSAECLPPVVTAELIEQGAKQSVQRLRRKDVAAAFSMQQPLRMTVEFKSSDMADRAAAGAAGERDGLKVSFTAPDMPSAYIRFEAMIESARPR